MPRKPHTTVVLDDSLQKIKDELVQVYGLKKTLSAGLWLFSRLSADEREMVITELGRLDSAATEAHRIVDAAAARAATHIRKKGHHASGAAG